jgi:predicted ribosomally synthesized peptide with SipW-like signal peptide
MARFAAIALGAALVIGQPVTAAWAQSETSSVNTESQERRPLRTPFLQDPAKMMLALAALASATWGFVNAVQGSNNSGRAPASP